jgi:hypothetical protein
LGAHMARQTLRENIKEHYREEDLASASRSVSSNASTTMSKRTQSNIDLDGVPPNVNDTFPKHVDEMFRKCRAVTIDRILNEAKEEQGGGREVDVGNDGASVLQVNGIAVNSSMRPTKYAEVGDGDDDDQEPHRRQLRRNSMSTSFRHLVKKVVNVVRDPKPGGDLVTKMNVHGTVEMGGDNVSTGVADKEGGGFMLTKTVATLGATGPINKRGHNGKDGHHNHEENQTYNPEDLQSRRKKSTSLLERVSGEHFAAKQEAAPTSSILLPAGTKNPVMMHAAEAAHSSSLGVILPTQAILTHQHHGSRASLGGSWDLR